MKALSRALLILLLLGSGAAVRAAEHPVEINKDSDCASCHEDKSKGKHVHSAVALGCTSCHEVKTEKGVSNVELVSPKNELCFTCHEKAQAEVKHGPYEKGNCTWCHDPHTSEFDKQLRAEGNRLCLECHNPYRRVEGDKVNLFQKTEITRDEFLEIPKVDLDRQLKIGHPMGPHPVTGVANPVKPEEQISCATCHQTHASAAPKLVRMKSPNEDFCGACHNVIDQKQSEANMKAHEQEQQQKKDAPQRPQGKDNKKKGGQ